MVRSGLMIQGFSHWGVSCDSRLFQMSPMNRSKGKMPRRQALGSTVACGAIVASRGSLGIILRRRCTDEKYSDSMMESLKCLARAGRQLLLAMYCPRRFPFFTAAMMEEKMLEQCLYASHATSGFSREA